MSIRLNQCLTQDSEPMFSKLDIMEMLHALFMGKTIVRTEFGFFRSEMCNDFAAGKKCKFGAQCHYAHGVKEICPKPYEDYKFKVKQCTCQNRYTRAFEGLQYLQSCNYGARCEWRHDEMVYVLEDECQPFIICVYYSKEEDRYRISLRPDIFESKIYVISLVKPNVHDPLFESIRPYLEAAKKLVPPQNPCEYFVRLNSNKCRIVDMETIGSNSTHESVLTSPPAMQQNASFPANCPRVQVPSNVTAFQCAPAQMTPPVANMVPSISLTSMDMMGQNMMPMVYAPEHNPNQQYMFSPTVYTPPPATMGFYYPCNPCMPANTFINPMPMQSVAIPEETYKMYNPDSMTDSNQGFGLQCGESVTSEECDRESKAPEQGRQGQQSQNFSESPLRCVTPEPLPLVGRTFITTPTRVSYPPPGNWNTPAGMTRAKTLPH